MKESTTFDWGDVGFRHDAAAGILFGSEARAMQWAAANAPDSEGKAEPVDTRPTLGLFARMCREYLEGDAAGNPFDEYISLAPGLAPGNFVPHGWRWLACYVVTGGSEGLYMHVEAVSSDGEGNSVHKMLLLAKCGASGPAAWAECWRSCGRLARFLQA
jgi:hypothetical protein